MEDYRLKIESLTISLAYDMGVMISEAQKEARADERNKVIEEVEETLKGLDCGFCNYEDEVKIRLNQLKGTEWVGVFAPNGGHDPNNPYPLKRKE